MADDQNMKGLTADIVSAFVARNHITPVQVSDLIASVYASLNSLGGPVEPVAGGKPIPVVPVKKSVQPGSISCLVCGKAHQSLKRHIGGHGFTPEEYRAAYDLPANYPMVAPEYAARRSTLAKTMGLGRKRKTTAEPVAKPAELAKPAKKPRAKKAAPAEAGE